LNLSLLRTRAKCHPVALVVPSRGTSGRLYPQGKTVATIRRLRPKQHDRTAEAIQMVLDLPLPLSPDVRGLLTDALSSYAPEPWFYIMLNREQARAIMAEINAGPRPHAVLRTWNAALTYAAYGTGEIEATREQLATVAAVRRQDVSRALSRLVEIGALIRTGRGHYALNPAVAWSGTLASREQAAQRSGLRLVDEPV
jgi:hypothetical protein